MKKRNQRHVKKVKNLILICTLCALILAVSTYAWFVGMKTVNVSSFDVEIAAIDGLTLSLNGAVWTDTIDISKETYSTNSYSGNTNSWGGDGLIPISTVGKIDSGVSRMVLYEKGSFTTTPGGYRVMASRVHNYDKLNDGSLSQGGGYVVFDLFVKNLSGNEYYPALTKDNEEAIYLTIDSAVTVAEDGGVENTGIENSVRVAFAQIGRVKATTTDVNKITGISCNNDNTAPTNGSTAVYDADVVGICANRDAQIWEPNDRDHVQNAINYYDTSCLKRTNSDLTLDTSYSGKCGTVKNGNNYNTYAVSGVIDYKDKVDVYDGADYNGYTTSVASSATLGKLVAYDYFTDSEKNLSGTERPTFITLAPNSITKIRIYIYIEGQDVDNYDFASLGKKISVKFGFTKERFFDEDVHYNPSGTASLPNDVIKALHTTAETQS